MRFPKNSGTRNQRRCRTSFAECEPRWSVTRSPVRRTTAGLQILELAQTAYSSYVAKNPHEQARLIKTLVSNSSFDRGSLSPTYVKPFDVFAKGSETGDWLGLLAFAACKGQEKGKLSRECGSGRRCGLGRRLAAVCLRRLPAAVNHRPSINVEDRPSTSRRACPSFSR